MLHTPVLKAARTLYVSRPVLNADEIVAWAKAQGFETTVPAEQMHVTVAFSRAALEWPALPDGTPDQVEIAAGTKRSMAAFGDDGAHKVLVFRHPDLAARHRHLRALGASWDHPSYRPHITISSAPGGPDLASVEPYAGPIILGPERFEEVKEGWSAGVVEKAQARHPAGSPQGGQFAPSGSSGGWLPWTSGVNAKKGPPPGAKAHPSLNDKGQPVSIDHPTRPSSPDAWADPKAVATFTPGGDTPHGLHGVPFAPWAGAPTTTQGWAAVPGQMPELDAVAFTPMPGKTVGAGVIIEEPDGRIWLTRPTNGYAGYENTFPKGTVEDGLGMQASAIKEAFEETGLRVEITGIVGDVERTQSFARYFRARRVSGTPADMGWESQAVRLAPRGALDKLLNKPFDRDFARDYWTERDLEDRVAKAFNGKQERWPAGSPLGGQWKATGTDGLPLPPKIGSAANPAYGNKAVAAHKVAQAGDTASIAAVAANLKAKVEANAASGVKSSHVKWAAQLSQYVSALVAAKQSAPKAEAAAARISGPTPIASWPKVGPKPDGAAPGGIHADPKGQKWLVKGTTVADKGPLAVDRARNELLSARLMAAAGAGVPDMKAVDLGTSYGGGLGVASKWVDGLQKIDLGNPAHLAAARADFAVQAWLANYDVMGPTFGNTFIGPDGQALCVDPGGALLFKGIGAPKAKLSPDAPEWETMRSAAMNPQAAAVYAGMTASQLTASAQKLALIDDATIKSLVETYGPENMMPKADLAALLIKRRDAILTEAGLQPGAKTAPAPEAPAPKPPEVGAGPVKGGVVAKPTFETGHLKAQGWYLGQADKAEALHADGDLDGLLVMKAGKSWPVSTINGKAMEGYHASLVADLQAAKAAQAADVAAGKAKVVGKDGTAWTGDGKGVLQPVAGPALWKVHGDKLVPVQEGLSGKALTVKAANAAVKVAGLPLKTKASPLTMDSGVSPQEAMVQAAVDGQLKALLNMPATGKLLDLKTGLLKAMIVPVPDARPFDLGADDPLVAELTGGAASQVVYAAQAGDIMGVFGSYAPLEVKVAVAAKMGVTIDGGAPAPTAPSAMAPKVAAAAPNFAATHLPETHKNSSWHNGKIAAIEAAFGAADEAAILALSFGSSGLSIKQVQTANNALAAMASAHKVSLGQKKGAHPALLGGTSQPATAAAVPPPKPAGAPLAAGAAPKRTVADLTVDKLPAKPDMSNYNGPGKPYSTKPWKNAANQAIVDAMQAAALQGGMEAVDALKFPALDPTTGEPTGAMLSAQDHPSKKIVAAYAETLSQHINDFLNPPPPLGAFQSSAATTAAELAAEFTGAPLLTPTKKYPAAQAFGFWLALGNAKAAVGTLKPAAPRDLTTTEIDAGKAAYKSYQGITKQLIAHVQASGAVNRAYSDGKATYDGMDLKAAAEAAYKDATPMPKGTTLYKWMQIPPAMLKQITGASEGTVFQSNAGMCTSQHPTDTKHFGPHRLIIRNGEGARALHSHGSGSFKSEKEITTLPNQRFLIVGRSQGGPGNTTGWDIEVVMLPTDEKP